MLVVGKQAMLALLALGLNCVSSFLAEQNIVQSLSRDFTVSNSASVGCQSQLQSFDG